MTNLQGEHGNITLTFVKQNGIGSHKIIRRKRDGELEYLPDELTIEEPLEIWIGRRAIATTMRTPGVRLKLNSTKRFGTISSSCGLCGKTTIEAIRQNFPALRSAGIRVNVE